MYDKLYIINFAEDVSSGSRHLMDKFPIKFL